MNSSNLENSGQSSSDQCLIRLQNIDVSLNGKRILSQIDWRLTAGENWAFLGGNGAGKTTLVRLIRGEIWPDPQSRGKRIYRLDGDEQTAPLGVREKIPVVSADLQDAYTRNQWNLTCEEVIYTGFHNSVWLFHKLDFTQQAIADRIMETLGVAHLRKNSYLELSNGEARKVLIARALVSHPPILILDEFGNGLDVDSRRSLFEFVERVAQNGTQIIAITHRFEELIPSITRALLLDGGKIVEQGEKDRVFQSESFVRLYRGNGHSSPHGKNNPIVLASGTTQNLPSIILEIHDADVCRDGQTILHGVDWRMRDDENWAVLGKNGSGKTTFLSLIYGSLHPALGGSIRRFDSPDGESSVWEVRKRMGYLTALLQADYEYNLTGEEVVQSGYYSSIGLWDAVPDEVKRAARRWIDFFQIRDLAEQLIHTMSYGELRKILLARAMINDPDILLLDEPCNGLDCASKAAFLDLLESLSTTHTRLIFVTHHVEDLIASITHALILESGRIRSQGLKADVLPRSPFSSSTERR